MAAIQRKLVHKQFNSPMGLYSQENVKATLNRELKAFGADGIEIDEQITKPLNLANSAVLRAVEEEEQQIKCGDLYANGRQSRPRQREKDAAGEPPHHALHQQLLDQIKTQYLSHQHDIVIDRDTVLRINRLSTRRHLLKRDHSWPPVEQEGGTVPTPSPSHSHSIEALREKFNSPTRIVEPTTRQLREQLQQKPTAKIPCKSVARRQVSAVERLAADKPQPQQPQQTPQAKGFSAPETKAADADIGLVAPKLEYYEQLTHKRPTTPTLRASTPYRPRLKRQSYSLDRGRAARKRAQALGAAPELPPLKPRNGSGNAATNGSGNGRGSGSGSGTPKVQRRSIKLATELKICYDGDSEEEPKASISPRPSSQSQSQSQLQSQSQSLAHSIDLEAMPLPALPPEATAAAAATQWSLPRKESTLIDSLALKQQQQLALALAGAAAAPSDSGRIIPITVSSSHPSQLEARVQQIYQDACSYLQQDQPNRSTTMTNNEDATPPATYVSATRGIKLQRQESAANKYKPQSPSIPTPPPLPPPPQPPLALLRVKSREDSKDKQARRQGGIYCSTAAAAASPASPTPPSQAKQHEAHVEIAQLEAKYAHIQQSITEHLRQIDAYMENAKTALQRSVQATPTPPPEPPETPEKPKQPLNNNNNDLWDLFASRQSPILAVESPLQAILRQIYCRAAGIQLVPKEHDTDTDEASVEPATPAENVPIVERALEDLHRIAVALDQDEHALLHVEHKTTPTAAKAQHVVIKEEEEEEDEEQLEDAIDMDYRHVSDVIANYEQLSTGKEVTPKSQEEATKYQDLQLSLGKKFIPKVQEVEDKESIRKVQDLQLSKPKESSTARQDLQLSIGKEGAINRQDVQLSLAKAGATKCQELKVAESAPKSQDQDQLTIAKESARKFRDLSLSVAKEIAMKRQEHAAGQEQPALKTAESGQDKPKKEQEMEVEKEEEQEQEQEQDKQSQTSGCAHEGAAKADVLGSWCAVCGECRDSPHGWGKLNKADQWRFDNLQNEPLANYKSTYEIRSPYISRQISWEDTQQPLQQQQQQETEKPLLRQRSVVEIITTPAAGASSADPPTETREWQLSRSPSPLPSRRYPAPLIETAQRCSSPFGLNPVSARASATATPTPTAAHIYVPQLEGHNIGLLVRTATEPLQLSMSASSSLLAAAAAGTPPATPRCNSQPPPFDFMLQHGHDLETSAEFQPIAAGGELHSTRDFSINRSFDNVSPRPYLGIEGYKRVAWPPASEERIVREFTPQPQTQSPAPGSGGYYPQSVAPSAGPGAAPSVAAAAAAAAAAPAAVQGPIYNNVQPRTQPQQQLQHQQPPQQQQQQYYQQQQQQPAHNGYTAATVAAAQAPTTNNYNYPQQPIQYTQAQFNRQRSREPVQAPPADTQQYQQQYPQQQQQQPQQQQQQQYNNYAVDNVAGGWKHIRAPLPKTHNDFTAGSVASAPYQQQQPLQQQQQPYSHQQQQQQLQQQQQYYQQQQPQQQQQYRAPSFDNYQQQQQQPPLPQQQQPHWQQQQLPQAQQQYQAPYQTSPYQQQQQQPQQQPQNYPQQNGGVNYAQPQYNSYSQPQPHQQQQQQQLPYSQDQTDQQHNYRGASPGIITLRKEAPVSQKPAPVYTSQPAAVSYQGGSKLRGDLKWPPPEYKEAAVRENEERRLLALGPVCRPRRVNRDYSNFFAQHQLNNAYPSYKVPPGTQHMFA